MPPTAYDSIGVVGDTLGIDTLAADSLAVDTLEEEPLTIDYDANHLEIPGDSSRLKAFCSSLRRMLLFGNDKINIVHIGGSHVQGDGLSAKPRALFSGIVDNVGAERGAFFPYSAAKTNGAANLSTSYTGIWRMCKNSAGHPDRPMGILGMDVYTIDPYATLSFDLNPRVQRTSQGDEACLVSTEQPQWTFSRLRLFAQMNDSITTPMLAVGKDTIEGVKDGASYLFECREGSSRGTLFFWHKLDSTMTRVPEVCVMCFIPENDRSGVTYHSLGVNGAALWSWLRCDKFDEQIGFLKPDLVILGVGINDANVPYSKFDVDEFKQQYRRLLQKIYRVSPDCAVVFITNNDCVLNLGRRRGKPVNQNTLKVEQAMRELAAEQGAAVWNQFRIMGGLGSSPRWVRAGLMCRDRIHFTTAGYDLLGEMLFESIMEAEKQWSY